MVKHFFGNCSERKERMTSYFKILENKGHVKNKGVKIVDNKNGCGIYDQNR